MIGDRSPSFGWRWIGRCILIKRGEAIQLLAMSSVVYVLGLVFPVSVQKTVDKIVAGGPVGRALATLFVRTSGWELLLSITKRSMRASGDHEPLFAGACPLAFATGNGAELRNPLGISIVGGLVLSQLITLYSTPVVYMFLNSAARSGHREGVRMVR